MSTMRAGAAPAVTLVRWPSEAALRSHVQRLGRARLLLIEDGADVPPTLDRFEDWVLASASPHEIELRATILARRNAHRPADRPVLEDGDLLRFDGAWVALSPTEVKVVRALLDRFDRCVHHEELLELIGAPEGSSSLNSLIKRLRARITPLGLSVNNVHGRGYVLSVRSFDVVHGLG